MNYYGYEPQPQQHIQEPDSPTVLNSVISLLYNNLNEQDAIIDGIYSKVNDILNKRASQHTSAPQPSEKQIDDAATRMKNECNRLATHNERLKDIHKHLSEII